MTDRSTWKKFERRVASFFGGRRNALSGRNSGDTAGDVRHPKLFVECKLSGQGSALFTLFNATAELAKREKKIPVLAMQQKYHNGFLVVVHCDSLEDVVKHLG